jgi:predicted kinase
MSVDLILLNGAPGVGKSTVAARFVADRPMVLNLDLDLVRRMLGRWMEAPTEAGLLARDLAVAMIDRHLASGHSVIVPQYLGRPDFIHRLDACAQAAGARFVEVILLASPDTVTARFSERGRAAAQPSHVEAAQLADPARGGEPVEAMHARLTRLAATRPAAHLIGTDGRTVEDVNGDLLRILG